MQHSSRSPDTPPEPPLPRSRKGETVLVVGGEPAAREAAILESLDYVVLRAADARAAIAALQGSAPVDLLFAPAALAGVMDRQGLAARARQDRPTMAVLLAGPAPAADAADGDPATAGIEFLDEGATPEDLACRVRHVLGNQQQVNALARALGHAAGAPAPATHDPRWRVLLVEDQDQVRDISRQLLELLGCEVQAVSDAEAADAALRQARFDVMLTDIMLPGRSGLELAQAAALQQPALKIVVSSGCEASTNGIAGVHTWSLPKPYGVRELQALLGEFART